MFLPHWERFNNFWRLAFEKDPENLLVVHYSVLKEKTMSELARILDFLNVDVSNKTMECVQNRIEGKYRRPPSQFKPFLDAPMIQHIDIIQHQVYQQFKIKTTTK